jgi:hypothetical protein
VPVLTDKERADRVREAKALAARRCVEMEHESEILAELRSWFEPALARREAELQRVQEEDERAGRGELRPDEERARQERIAAENVRWREESERYAAEFRAHKVRVELRDAQAIAEVMRWKAGDAVREVGGEVPVGTGKLPD